MRVKVRVYKAEKGGFWAVVPGLPNCVSEGETLEQGNRTTFITVEF